jgi:hypothetical protein
MIDQDMRRPLLMHVLLAISASVVLAGCGQQAKIQSPIVATSPTSNAFLGSWETVTRKNGVVVMPNHHALFFTVGHMCPTLWATYAMHDQTLVATDMYGHTPRHVISVDTNGMLHDRTTKLAYHRVRDAELQSVPGVPLHC